ncbi:hypothetical protein SEA_VANLEE_155 [Gordonia phage VanLee]|uniref:Uncharacterized protein n=1 Tax=Gordonia phage VanLee TaxID=2845816 RepID=A0A8F2DAH4_9CAUD|nr:hypothetical protein QEH49_gp135 [Gordonia phage VanLee]QWS68271.1 hypothetical protein SEA_VANLEE_155 [Gordonia phage VanLee]
MTTAVVICPHCLVVRRVPNHERNHPTHRRCRDKVRKRLQQTRA